MHAKALHSKAEWGHGVGRHARQMRGEIVSTCKKLRVRSKSRRVQTGQYPCLYQKFAAFLSLKENTLAVCEYVSEYISRAGRFRTGVFLQHIL